MGDNFETSEGRGSGEAPHSFERVIIQYPTSQNDGEQRAHVQSTDNVTLGGGDFTRMRTRSHRVLQEYYRANKNQHKTDLRSRNIITVALYNTCPRSTALAHVLEMGSFVGHA